MKKKSPSKFLEPIKEVVSRPLDTKEQVENFIRYTLNINESNGFKVNDLAGLIAKIVDGENNIKIHASNSTYTKEVMRENRYRSETSRWELREQIIDELYTCRRLNNDEGIRLGKNGGGALPINPLKSEKQAFILIGLPASGKSTIANTVAEQYGAIIIDSDYAKRKLPEFRNHIYGATIVHTESSRITFGFAKDNNPGNLLSLYEKCLINGHNIVLPTIGQNPKSVLELVDVLKRDNQYDVHLILVSLPRREATIRAIHRFNTTKRYVPLGLIYDTFGNDTSHCYYYLRTKYPDLFVSMGVVSTRDRTPYHTDSIGNSPVNNYDYKETILELP